jgi:hypothetical protein
MIEGEHVDENVPMIMFLVDIDEPGADEPATDTGAGFSTAKH